MPWSIYWFVKLAYKQEIFGYGSFKALAAIGAWVAPEMAIAACLLALLLKVMNWFPFRSDEANVGCFCPLGPELAVVGIAAIALNSGVFAA